MIFVLVFCGVRLSAEMDDESDPPEAEPGTPRGRSRLNLRRISDCLTQLATGDLFE
jgi:hypothetical protein